MEANLTGDMVDADTATREVIFGAMDGNALKAVVGINVWEWRIR